MPSSHISIRIHLVFSTKERWPYLEAPIRDSVHRYLGGCLTQLGAQPLGIGGVADHVHLAVGLRATHAVADVVRDIKKPATDWIRTELRIRKFAWQEGYAAYSVSASRPSALQTYIARQEEHHRVKTFQEEYLELLEAHGVDYDPSHLW
jgi:putative transposase